MTIRKKLPVIISLLVFLPLLLTSIITYSISSKDLNGDAEKLIKDTTRYSGDTISAMIETESREAELLAKNSELILASKQRLQMTGEDYFTTDAANRATALLKERAGKLEDRDHIFLLDTKGTVIADSKTETLKFDLSARKYFQDGISGKQNISDTIKSKTAGSPPVVVFSSPIYDESGKVIAVISNAVKVQHFAIYLKNVKTGKTGYGYLLDSTGMMLYHPKSDKIAQPVENTTIKEIVEELKAGKKLDGVQYGDTNYGGTPKVIGYEVIPGAKWLVVITQDKKDIISSSTQLGVFTLMIAGVCLIVALIIGILFSANITRPLARLTKDMERASLGDISFRSGIKRKDEIGMLAKSFNVMAESISEMIALVKQRSQALEDNSNNLSQVSQQMSSSSEEVAGAIQDVARGASEQAGSLTDITSKFDVFSLELERIIAEIKEIGVNSKEVSHMAVESNKSLQPLIESVERIKDSFEGFSKKIGELGKNIGEVNSITELINSISDQTNLLALNAAIEAARAGESGRGFSVVAEEIRKLAEQSKTSAESISSIVRGISGQASEMISSTGSMKEELQNQVSVINSAVDSFVKIIGSIETVLPKIDAVNSSAAGIQQEKDVILKDVESLAAVSEEVSASSEEIAASSEQMSASSQQVSSASQELSALSIEMNKDVNKFKL